MSLSDKITILSTELEERQKAQQARAFLQNLRSTIIQTNADIQVIADGGSFTTLDVDIKNALIAAWDISKTAETAFEDVVISELLDWRP